MKLTTRQKYLVFTILAFFVSYPSVAWFMMLVNVITWGKRLIYEPNLFIVYVEFSMTVIAFITTLSVFGYCFLKIILAEPTRVEASPKLP